eukprot:CAMPEP_0202419466 /NCGR_PEP_ID=MMETSP1128-20130828/49315_1 /ASSEMBLY_ACC=CAM_ASM_000463 /TAXON_ID=3047 /ORGANISM="Dunaliella tertiolecta, Strain CCMP1320" /LENGTH=116 /DNA_ID=CAMNT_0049027413 /DNA_START=3339 /DNA_END=3689 /DNA_ORIENTATION=+
MTKSTSTWRSFSLRSSMSGKESSDSANGGDGDGIDSNGLGGGEGSSGGGRGEGGAAGGEGGGGGVEGGEGGAGEGGGVGGVWVFSLEVPGGAACSQTAANGFKLSHRMCKVEQAYE